MAWASLLRQHAQFPYAQVVIAAPLPPSSEGDSQDYLLPDIIWDPVQQFPAVFETEEKLKCFEPNCGLPLQCLRWQDGYKPRYNPRSIYGLKWSCVPRCTDSALFPTTSNYDLWSMQRCWPNSVTKLVFHLYCYIDVVGLETFPNWLFTLAVQGLSFSDIEVLLYGHIQERYFRTQIVFLCNLSHKLLPQQSSCTPAIKSLPSCMLQSMSNDEIMYSCMQLWSYF